MELGRQVSGFEPEALNMMTRYNWPGNYTQFKHVLHELTILTPGPYISATDVAELLAQERKVYRRVPDPASAPSMSGMTLSEICASVARQVLAENHGNQTQTARQLGISRTTLWRMLSGDG
jgi:DNA-binding NtrC family response regulator